MAHEKLQFGVYEDGVDNRPPFHMYADLDCNCGDLWSLCQKGCTAPAPGSIPCPGCSHCSNLIPGALRQESTISTGDVPVHPTKPAAMSDTLFQISSNDKGFPSVGSEEVALDRTTDATILVSQPHHNHQSPTSEQNQFHTSATTTPVRSTFQPSLINESSASTGGQDLYHSPTRDLVDQQRRSRVSQPVLKTCQPSHHSKSPSLTGSQDSLIPASATRKLVGQQRDHRASQPAVKTHAEKLRAALACPVDELSQVKAQPQTKTPLKKKMGSLWRKIQARGNDEVNTRMGILSLPNRKNLKILQLHVITS
ncbi:hypothetical protein DSL72_006577 [Monilinia vaccinii-corymbosi]|uniref:Uncharacterized protein n=1 Tax=Monilinia vaccinii-corymbosi TaxID=61207 RepID=A0A8A3PPE9_9HELO|nr:hypothetical protein DSL72_006577 [Monilinia vaccinii-corymbosi]